MPEQPTGFFHHDNDDLVKAVSGLTKSIDSSTQERKKEFEYAQQQDAALLASLLHRANSIARRIKAVAKAFKQLDDQTQ